MKKRLFATLLALVMALGLAVTAAADEATDLNAWLAEKTDTDPAVNVVFEYGAFNDPMTVTVTGYVLNNGSYKLTGDLTITAPLVIQGTVTLDLNGHVLTYGGTAQNSVIVVDAGEGVSFTLKDSGSGGKITGGTGTKYDTGYPAESWVRGGGVFVGSQATFNMSGGSIEGCSTTDGDNNKGGGVYLASGYNENKGSIAYTTFNMSGGSIENCSSGQGGGVGTGTYANITIKNSEISGCEATSGGGGGVGVGGASNILSMTNSTISNCTAAIGGGVSAGNSSGDGTFTMENSSITNCTAQIGGGVYHDCGYFTMKDGSTISGCKAIFVPATIGERFHGGGGVYIRKEVFTMEAGSVISGCTSSDGKSDSLNLGNENHCYMRTYGGSVYGSVYNRNCDIENTATDGSTIFYGEITNGDNGEIVGKRVRFMNGDTLYAETVANKDGGKISQPTAPTAPEGKHFSGWYTAQSNGTKWEFTTATVSKTMNLYAQWHDAVDANNDHICDVDGCTEVVSDHTGGDWQFDSSGHWRICATCGETYAEAAHDGSPCTVCGYEQSAHSHIRRQSTTPAATDTTTDTTTDVVTSAKTFDTGVAVYGAMAVASLLGMGYVGKKRV